VNFTLLLLLSTTLWQKIGASGVLNSIL